MTGQSKLINKKIRKTSVRTASASSIGIKLHENGLSITPSKLYKRPKSERRFKNSIVPEKQQRPKTSLPSKSSTSITDTTRIQTACIENLTRLPSAVKPDILHSYLSHADIMKYLHYLQFYHADFVKIHTLGYSYEGRSIKAIEINWKREQNEFKYAPTLETGARGRNIVFIEGGIHAREWISITVALYCIQQLVERNGRHRSLLQKLRFFIVPLVNPDGYEYSRIKNPNWRKNRKPHSNESNTTIGTDCNRNWDYHWEDCYPKCKRNTYGGEKPFSEPETKALAATLQKLQSEILFYLSLHSYAQSLMYPWAHTKTLPKNAKILEKLAKSGRNAIKARTGRYYRVGSISQLTQRTIAGSVIDYVYGVIRVPFTLVMELPSNEYGFQPSTNKIYPLGEESWHGIKEMCIRALQLRKDFDENADHSSIAEEKTKIDLDMQLVNL